MNGSGGFYILAVCLASRLQGGFLYRVLKEPGHWAKPIFDAYKQNLPDYARYNESFVRYPLIPNHPDVQAYMHICENAVNSNVTVLDVIGGAVRHGHYRLWSEGTTRPQCCNRESTS